MTTGTPQHPRQPLTGAQVWYLREALNPAQVSTRSGLSYLEAWSVKASLIRVFGFGGFSAEVIESKILDVRETKQRNDASKTNIKVTAQATVRLTIHQLGAVYTETAVAGSSQPDITESMDMALKSAESDALKRCAIYLGTQFGLSLYNNASTQDVVGPVYGGGQEQALAEWLRDRQAPQPAAALPQYGQMQPPPAQYQQPQQQGGHTVTPSAAGSAFQD